jgi:hypothetical protein
MAHGHGPFLPSPSQLLDDLSVAENKPWEKQMEPGNGIIATDSFGLSLFFSVTASSRILAWQNVNENRSGSPQSHRIPCFLYEDFRSIACSFNFIPHE